MKKNELEALLARLRNGYNTPPKTPREEMWAHIQSRLEARDGSEAPNRPGVDHESDEGPAPSPWTVGPAKRRRVYRQVFGWGIAAAALLVLGLGIGRMTAPGVPSASPESSQNRTAQDPGTHDPLRVAALDHLVRTESLLTLARADARSGRVEPTMGSWARTLLNQTRLLMDAQESPDPILQPLLEDLELALVQLVRAAGAASDNEPTADTEIDLALQGLEHNELLPRIRAVIPDGPRFLGT